MWLRDTTGGSQLVGRKDGLSRRDHDLLDKREIEIGRRRKNAKRVHWGTDAWSTDCECGHGRLPGDPLPHIGVIPIGYHLRKGGNLEPRYGPPGPCDCWDHRTIGLNAAEELLEAMAALTQQVEALASASRSQSASISAQAAAIKAQTEVLAHVDRNVTAVGYQVSQNGRDRTGAHKPKGHSGG